MLIEADEKTFEDEILYSDLPVIVDFWTKGCMPCLSFAPTFEKLSKRYAGKIKFVKCDVGKNKAIADFFGIKAVPTVLIFCQGKTMHRMVGKYEANKIEKELKKVIKSCTW